MTASPANETTGVEARRCFNHGSVTAMGLSFASPLGLAAGVDRDGENIASLDLAGFGHIEIGTITGKEKLNMSGRPASLRIGVNIGSSRYGLDDQVIDDYLVAMRHAYPFADYLCANLTSPRSGRDANSLGVVELVGRLKTERDLCAAAIGRHAPLLIKIDGGEQSDPIPTAVLEARRQELEGIVLVCSCLRRIAGIKRHLDSLTLISVGGIGDAEQANSRINAGAALVQVHRAFVENKVGDLRRMHENRPS
ncbi:dihydroorotate oxidase [Rhodoblastus sp.]|jgi:dihydroorotate dehydrogenase|uniref:dihydroorotate oxidase n=1 Tax=Rhodoblastus sp. TaxID=1962975 RepID=UPI0025E62C7E|nr:dihydroorotate oxidase [Rhodoblastus sp.]